MFDIPQPIPDIVLYKELEQSEKNTEREIIMEQLHTLTEISDKTDKEISLLKKQLNFAIKESNSTKKDAFFSKVIAIISIIISIIAIIMPMITK